MDISKLSLRPKLNLSSIISDEDFQNKTLRPVLKLQNDLILKLFSSFCEKQKIDITNIRKDIFFQEVDKIIKKNIVLRNQYIGLVVGMFTTDEFDLYTEKAKVFNKRILNMIVQRISDNR